MLTMRPLKSLTIYFVLASGGATLPATCLDGPTEKAGVALSLTDTEKDAFIQMDMWNGGLSGLQTVVVKNGRIVWMKSYGYAVLVSCPGDNFTKSF